MERVQRARLVEVQKGVVAAGKYCGDVVAVALVGGMIDDADSAVLARLEEFAFLGWTVEDEELVLLACLVENGLPAPFSSRRLSRQSL